MQQATDHTLQHYDNRSQTNACHTPQYQLPRLETDEDASVTACMSHLRTVQNER